MTWRERSGEKDLREKSRLCFSLQLPSNPSSPFTSHLVHHQLSLNTNFTMGVVCSAIASCFAGEIVCHHTRRAAANAGPFTAIGGAIQGLFSLIAGCLSAIVGVRLSVSSRALHDLC